MSQAMEPYGFDTDQGSQDGKHHRRRNSVELFPPQVTSKMKGLFKGLRYISQIFEPNGKEHEMQIGLPTDVKHVAHIGWDGPSVIAPTWMSEFKSGPDLSSRHLGAYDAESKSATSEVGVIQSPQSRDLPELPKPSRRHSSSSSARHRESSRHRDSSSASESRHSRRQQQQQQQDNDEESGGGEKPAVPRSVRKKKTKGSSHALSTRDAPKADHDLGEQGDNNAAADKMIKEREQENET